MKTILYGCETWSLTLREELRLRVFENRTLRRIFGPKRDEATACWRKLHNVELSNLHSSPKQKKDEMGWECCANSKEYKCIQSYGRKF
jgi:hypothetical protein